MSLLESLRESVPYEVTLPDLLPGVTLRFELRKPTTGEDTQYQRMTGKAKFNRRSGEMDLSDTSINAQLWLLKTLVTKMEYKNGSTDGFQTMSDEEFAELPIFAKRDLINRHIATLQGEHSETLGNSQRS